MLLSLMIFIPLLGMIAVLLLPRESDELIKRVTLFFTLVPLAVAVALFISYDRSTAGTQYVVNIPWIQAFNIQYHIGIDGLSVTLLLLTALLGPICVIASWRNIEKGIKAYMALFLLLETGILGFFVALDLFLFYVFFELTLLPMYFLIGIWGGPRREYAAIKFFLYTLFGSVLMLVAMIAVYLNSGALGARTFDIPTLITLAATEGNALNNLNFQIWVFLGFFIGFAVKVPIFPFHTWLPDAHVEAPTAISVILAGILLKMGTYGLVRINMSMFPQGLDFFCNGIGFWGNSLALLGFINIVYGSFCALAQTDLRSWSRIPVSDTWASSSWDFPHEMTAASPVRCSRCSITELSVRCSSYSSVFSTTEHTTVKLTDSAVWEPKCPFIPALRRSRSWHLWDCPA